MPVDKTKKSKNYVENVSIFKYWYKNNHRFPLKSTSKYKPQIQNVICNMNIINWFIFYLSMTFSGSVPSIPSRWAIPKAFFEVSWKYTYLLLNFLHIPNKTFPPNLSQLFLTVFLAYCFNEVIWNFTKSLLQYLTNTRCFLIIYYQ